VFDKSEQKFNDQKLEFFTETRGINCCGKASNINKIYHGPSPIIIKFKDTPARVIIFILIY
jgi:hypothetical protein